MTDGELDQLRMENAALRNQIELLQAKFNKLEEWAKIYQCEDNPLCWNPGKEIQEILQDDGEWNRSVSE